MSRKLLVWDIDNTIWKGIYLYDKDAVELKPKIIDIVKGLDNRGILQSIISKNPPEVKTILKQYKIWDYFVFPKINWNFKPINMGAIMESLHALPKHVVFIDDDITERKIMNMRYPEILCIDAREYGELLNRPEFEVKEVTTESRNRRLFFKTEEKRLSQLTEISPEEFLTELKMEVRFSNATDSELGRVQELYNRTNRMNATGERYTIQQIRDWFENPEKKIITGYASDKFGSYGTVSVAFLEGQGTIEGLAISCRALDRGILPALLSVLGRRGPIKIKVKETRYNEVFRNYLKEAGCRDMRNGYWVGENINQPKWVKIYANL